MFNFINILGYKVFSDSLKKIKINDKTNFIINTINPHSYIVAKKDGVFKKVLQTSDILLPDGIGIVWAVRFLTRKKINRITGADIHEYLLKELNKNNGKVFYMGASQSTLQKIKEKIKQEYPNVLMETYSPPYKPTFTKKENKAILIAINNFNPDVLFVGMTAPKQEKWVYENKERLNVKIIASIGAVFDFYAGTVKRAPLWIQKFGLEWLHRSIKNPKKLGARNLTSNPKFIFDVLKSKLL